MARIMRGPRISLAAALGVGALALGACGGGSDEPSGTPATSERPAGDTLRIAVEQAPDPLDPATLGDNRSIELAQNVFGGLTDVTGELEIEPNLAEDWKSNKDSTRFTFTLRDDLVFQNGDPVTAEDVAYSLNRTLSPEVGSGYTFFLSIIDGASAVTEGEVDEAKGIEVLDRRRLRITTSAPAAYLPALASRWPYWVVDRDVVEAGGDDWTDPGTIVGTGPYTLTAASGETEYTFEAAEQSSAPPPPIKKVEITVVPDPATRLARYEAGEFDAIFGLSASAFAQVQRDEALEEQLGTIPLLRTAWLSMRNDREPFDDIRVRKAFNMAIDRQALVDVALGGLGEPAHTFLPPGMPGVAKNTVERPFYEFDAAEAQRLLAEAGFPEGQGFPELDIHLPDTEEARTTAELIQAQLQENLGIQIGLRSMPQNAYNDMLNDSERRSALHMYTFGLDYPDPQEMLEFFGTRDGFVNYSDYRSDEYDRLVQEGNTSPDPEARAQAYRQAEDLFLDAASVAPLYHPIGTWLSKPYVEGVGSTPLYQRPWSAASFQE